MLCVFAGIIIWLSIILAQLTKTAFDVGSVFEGDDEDATAWKAVQMVTSYAMFLFCFDLGV